MEIESHANGFGCFVEPSAVRAAPASKKPSACPVEIIDDGSDLEDLLEREIGGGAKLPLVLKKFQHKCSSPNFIY